MLKGARSLGPIIHSSAQVIPVSIAVPPLLHILRDFTDVHHVSSQVQVLGSPKFQPYIHLLAGAWPLPQLHLSVQSKVLQGNQQSTCKVCGHAQHTFFQFCHCYSLLPVPANQETLLCFATFPVDAKGIQHRTILGYLYGVTVLHIDMGLSDLLKDTLQLHKGLQAIHIQSNPASHNLAFTYELLVLNPYPTQIPCTVSLMG